MPFHPLPPSAGWNLNVIAGTPTAIWDHKVNLGLVEQSIRGGLSPWLWESAVSAQGCLPPGFYIRQKHTSIWFKPSLFGNFCHIQPNLIPNNTTTNHL